MSAWPDPAEIPPVDEAAEDEAILAAVRAGQGVSHDAVKRWLLSKNTGVPLPRPKAGE